MKRFVAFLLCVALSVSLAACSVFPPSMDAEGGSVPSSAPTQSTQPPVTEPPVTEPPVTKPPVTEPPVTEPPATEPPITEPPVVVPPVTEPPATPPPHAHNHVLQRTDPATCTVPGAKLYACTCGDSYSVPIAAPGHSWGSWQTVQPPTESAAGTARRSCNNCPAFEDKALEKLPGTTGTVTAEHLRRIEEGFLMLVNLERQNCGVAPLTMDAFLDSAAQLRSVEIVELFSHTRPNGESCFTAVDDAYPAATLGENICFTTHVGTGSYTPADQWVGSDAQIEAAYSWVFKLFKDSPGHYENMIRSTFEECGIGVTCKIDETYGIPYFYVAHMFGAKYA